MRAVISAVYLPEIFGRNVKAKLPSVLFSSENAVLPFGSFTIMNIELEILFPLASDTKPSIVADFFATFGPFVRFIIVTPASIEIEEALNGESAPNSACAGFKNEGGLPANTALRLSGLFSISA